MATPKHLPGDVVSTDSIMLEATAMHHHRRGDSVNNSSLPTPVVVSGGASGTVSEIIPELQSSASVFGWNPHLVDPTGGGPSGGVGAEWHHDFTNGGSGQNPSVQALTSSWNNSSASSDYHPSSGYQHHQDQHHHNLHHGGASIAELQFQTAGGGGSEIPSTNNLCSSTTPTGFSMSYHQNTSGQTNSNERPISTNTIVQRNNLTTTSRGPSTSTSSTNSMNPMVNNTLRPHSTPATLCWLEKNYELSDGVCIPRNVVYYNYTDFCRKNGMQPVNAASFGKIIRQMFQSLTTRRLGTRGQSRYHYYGLAVKPSSIYYIPSYSHRKYSRDISSYQPEVQWNPPQNLSIDTKQLDPMVNNREVYNFPTTPIINESYIVMAPNVFYESASSSSSNIDHHGISSGSGGNSVGPASLNTTGSSGLPTNLSKSIISSGFTSIQQLPEFPTYRGFSRCLDEIISEERFTTLMTMYRAHSQRIMDSINKFSFVEIPCLFKHFWQELPGHILCFIGQKSIITVIGICDKILYSTILKAILPSPIQLIPDDMIKILRNFADELVVSLQEALKRMPSDLTYMKMRLVNQLSQCLKRRTSVNHLYQAACIVVSPGNLNTYECLLSEWNHCDWDGVAKFCSTKSCPAKELLKLGMSFQKLLEDKESVKEQCNWILGIIDTKIKTCTPADDSMTQDLISVCEKLINSWNILMEKMFQDGWREVNLRNSKSTHHFPSNSLQLLRILFNELILHEIEYLLIEHATENFISGRSTIQDPKDTYTMTFLNSLGPDFLSKIRQNFSSAAAISTTENSLNEKTKLKNSVKLEAIRYDETTTIMV